MEPPSVLFEERHGSVIANADWPEQIGVPDTLLLEADPDYLQLVGRQLRFTVANGEATYHLVERLARHHASVWTRGASSWHPPEDLG